MTIILDALRGLALYVWMLAAMMGGMWVLLPRISTWQLDPQRAMSAVFMGGALILFCVVGTITYLTRGT